MAIRKGESQLNVKNRRYVGGVESRYEKRAMGKGGDIQLRLRTQ